MKIEHVALTISNPDEINNFYHDILGMNEVKSFTLDKNLAVNIFGLNAEPSVYQLQKDDLILEIFITPKQKKENFDHICLVVSDRETLFNKAKQNSYGCIRIERQVYDLMFIKDKSGNIFEIKEK
jgi:catechol 2,3-dioxygenase-like lactoylglutathione lyase family enzyme